MRVKRKIEVALPGVSSHKDVADKLDAVASIRRGLAQAREGAGRPADEVFDELEREDTGG